VTLQRAAIAAVAVLAIGWLALSYRDARLIRDIQIVAADPHATPAQVDAALRDARRPHTLDPSRTESLSYAAVLEIRRHHLAQARALLEEVVRREPDAAEPYLLLAELTRTSDPARSARARAELHRLDPMGTLP
jgi:predicted Zn-dependent protease